MKKTNSNGNTYNQTKVNAKGKKVNYSYKYFDMKIYFFSNEEREAVKRQAKALDMTVSNYVRHKLKLA